MKIFDVCIRAFVKGNLGDDLFVITLCERYPNTRFVISGEKKYRSIFINISNLTYVSIDDFFVKWIVRGVNIIPYFLNAISKRTFRKEILCRLRLFDFISMISKYNVLISGSLFMESEKFTEIESIYYKYEKKYYSRKPFVLGCNFGPFLHQEYVDNHQKLFRNASVVNFRDSYSKNLFTDKKINWYPDILFALKINNLIAPIEKNYILISVLNYEKDGVEDYNTTKKYIEKLCKIIDELIENGEKIVLVGFCIEQKDNLIIESIINKVRKPQDIKVINYPNSTYILVLSYLANAKYIIATRYHAMILGWLFNKKVFSIVYNQKMQNVIDDLNNDYLKNYSQTIQEIDKLDVSKILMQLNMDNNAPDFSQIISNSNKHFTELDQLID